MLERHPSYQESCGFSPTSSWCLPLPPLPGGPSSLLLLLCDEQPLAAASLYCLTATIKQSFLCHEVCPAGWGLRATAGLREQGHFEKPFLLAAGLGQRTHLAHTLLSCWLAPSLLCHLLLRSFRETHGCAVKREGAYDVHSSHSFAGHCKAGSKQVFPPSPQWTDAIVKILFISSHHSDILAFLCVSFQLKNNILPLLIFLKQRTSSAPCSRMKGVC